MTYRVREWTRDISGAPGHKGFKNYWVYVSDEIFDYYQAILYTIDYEKKNGIACWVDCVDTYKYFDNERLTDEGFVYV